MSLSKFLAISVIAVASFLLGMVLANYGPSSGEPTPLNPTEPPPRTVTRSVETIVADHQPSSANPPTLVEIANVTSEFERRHLAHELAAGASENELHDLFVEAAEISRTSDRVAVSAIFLKRLAEFDAPRALTLALDSEFLEAAMATPYLSMVFHDWARTDLDTAIERAKSLQDRNLKFAAFFAIIALRDDLLEGQILQLTQKIDDRDFSNYLNARKKQAEIQEDPQAAWQDATAIRDDNERHQKLSNIARIWAEKDPKAVMQAALLVADRNTRQDIASVALSKWLLDDPEQAIDWINHDQSISDKEGLIWSMVGRVNAIEPRRYIDLIQKIEDGAYRSRALEALIGDWGYEDPQSALEWVVNESEGSSFPDSLYGRLLGEYAKQKPDESFDLLFSLPLKDRTQIVQDFTQGIKVEDMRNYADQLQRFDNEKERIKATRSYINQWSFKNPVDAANWTVRQELGTSRDARFIYQRVFERLANHDLKKAEILIGTMPPSLQRDEAIAATLKAPEADNLLKAKLTGLISDPKLRATIGSVDDP